MKPSNWREKIAYLSIGAAATVMLMFLAGATTTDKSEIGRYRMCCASRGSFTEVYVIDTTTGVVKWQGSGDDGKPFQEIK